MTDDDLTKTDVREMITADRDELAKRLNEKHAHRGRNVEDIAMYVGLVQAALYGFVEALVFLLRSLGKIPDGPHPFPWVTMALFLGCILPKTVGRATAGRIWTGLGAAAAERLKGGK